VLYTGSSVSGSEKSRSVSGLGFKPDLVWLKSRGIIQNHQLYDSVRGFGGGKGLSADENRVEGDIGGFSDTDYGFVSSADDNGFGVISTHSTGTWVNNTGVNYVAWCWKAGGAAVSNTDGSVTSQVSVNQTAGFSIVSYTGTGAAISVGHGLEKAPAFIISKNRSIDQNWPIYHQSTSNIGTSAQDVVYLNLTIVGNSDNFVSVNDTTFSTTTWNGVSGNGNEHIAYCWSEIEGYSKFGSYVGNGDDDGPFVYCGFKPAWVMVKRSTTGADEGWPIFDSSRGSTNPNPKGIYANSYIAENDASGRYKDFVSNGFKVRGTSGEQNTNGITYIFAAFAESPFQTANAK
jgi:hypothetical protein